MIVRKVLSLLLLDCLPQEASLAVAQGSRRPEPAAVRVPLI